MAKIDKETMRQEMREEVDCMTEGNRLLDEYNYMFGKELTPEDVSDYEEDQTADTGAHDNAPAYAVKLKSKGTK